MENEIYSDGIGDIIVTGAVVRIDFVSLSIDEKTPAGKPKPVVRQRIVMPVEGFLHSLAVMEQIRRKLADSARIAGADDPDRPPVSSNFP